MNELSAFFRPTPVDSPACNNGRIAIDAYPEIINDRRRGPDSWIINPGYPLLFTDIYATFALAYARHEKSGQDILNGVLIARGDRNLHDPGLRRTFRTV